MVIEVLVEGGVARLLAFFPFQYAFGESDRFVPHARLIRSLSLRLERSWPIPAGKTQWCRPSVKQPPTWVTQLSAQLLTFASPRGQVPTT